MLFPFGTDNSSLASIANITELVINYLDDSAIVIDQDNPKLSGSSNFFPEVETEKLVEQQQTINVDMEGNDGNSTTKQTSSDLVDLVQKHQMVQAHIEEKDADMVYQEAREGTFFNESPKRRRLFSFDAQQNNAEPFGGTISEPHNESCRSTPGCPAGLFHREHECCKFF